MRLDLPSRAVLFLFTLLPVFVAGSAASEPVCEIGDPPPPVIAPEWTRLDSTDHPESRWPLALWDGSQTLLIAGKTYDDIAGDAGTYGWSGTGWEERAAPGDGPTMRTHFAAAYDASRDRVVVFGGQRRWQYNLSDTWEWDGTHWSEIASPCDAPPPRYHHSLAYDPVRERVVLVGGRNGDGFLQDVWEWDGACWTDLTPAAHDFPGLTGFGMAYDPERAALLMVGGKQPWSSTDHLNSKPNVNVWTWDGNDFDRLYLVASLPRDGLALAFDPVREKMVASGGSIRKNHDLYNSENSWALMGNQWKLIEPKYKDQISCCGQAGADLFFEPTLQALVRGDARGIEVQAYTELPNQQPHWSDWPPYGRRVFAHDSFELQLGATDPDGHPIHYGVSGLPPEAQIDPGSGLLTWTPQPSQAGDYTAVLIASDGDLCSTWEMSLRVDWIDYPMLPAGNVSLKTAGWFYFGSTEKEYRGNPKKLYSAQRKSLAACSLSGVNPGKVTVSCDVSTGAYFHWGPMTTSGSAPLESDGTFKLYGGTAPSTTLSGSVVQENAYDHSLTVTGFKARYNDYWWMDFRESGTTFLNPTP